MAIDFLIYYFSFLNNPHLIGIPVSHISKNIKKNKHTNMSLERSSKLERKATIAVKFNMLTGHN